MSLQIDLCEGGKLHPEQLEMRGVPPPHLLAHMPTSLSSRGVETVIEKAAVGFPSLLT